MARIENIAVERIFLDTNNPRHEPLIGEPEIIEYLCREEAVYELARDIVAEGLNPLEALALLPLKIKGKPVANAFVSAEGNRRVCALKLLHDPEKAPSKLKERFRKLSKKTHAIRHVSAVIFKDQKSADPWLERLHGGAKPGVGRKNWNADQKARHFSHSRNAFALRVLDYAESEDLIDAKERRGKLTTAQRYLGNPAFQDAVGLYFDPEKGVTRTRTHEDADKLLDQFMRDLVTGVANSRTDEKDIAAYAKGLAELDGISNERVPSVAIQSRDPVRRKRRSPSEPEKPSFISGDVDVSEALEKLDNYKLQRLYFSICNVSLEKFTPLVAVGVWAFLETLTAACGRTSGTSFLDFLTKDRLSHYGFTDKDQVKTIRLIVERISHSGNTTKHHVSAAEFNGEQLVNDLIVLRELILQLAGAAQLMA